MDCSEREVIVVHDVRQPAADRSPRSAVLVLSLFLAVPAALILFVGYRVTQGGNPTDDELTGRFLSHESDFQALAQMLDSDRRKRPFGAEPVGLADLAAAGTDAPRIGDYKVLLSKIDVEDFRYFPRSGNIALPVSKPAGNLLESTKRYSYLRRDEPQPLLYRRSYGWRGPALYFVSGDRRIKGQWFIHHEEAVAAAFSPY